MAPENVSTKPIVAGIICTKTGEISDTITNPSGKTRLYLKARDELNALHGKDAFMVFDLSMAIGDNLDYVKRHMKSERLISLNKVYLLRALYNIRKLEVALERNESELSLTTETMEECLAFYSENTAVEKRELVADAFSNGIDVLETSIDSIKRSLVAAKRKVNKLKSDMNNHADI